MIIALSLIIGSVVVHFSSLTALLYAAGMVGGALVIDALLLRLRHQSLFPLWAAAVSGCIIALLNPPRLWWLGGVAIFLAIISKQFIKVKNRHLFNPAAFGLFWSSLVLQATVSWWGVSFQEPGVLPFQLLTFLSFVILLSPGIVSVIRLKRYWMIGSFWIVYVVANTWLHRSDPSLSWSSLLLDPTVLFFSLVMLPEPMTSPNKTQFQVLYGIVVAAVAIILSLPLFHLTSIVIPDVLILALLIGNLTFAQLK